MNAADILGELLGGKSGGIFKDIFAGAGGSAAAPERGRARQDAPAPSRGDIASQAKELEDMMGVGRGGAAPSRPVSRPQSPAKDPWETPEPTRVPPPLPQTPTDDPLRRDSEAVVLIRAMIHAAKADGRLTPEEQKALIDRMGGASPEVIRFLRNELDQEIGTRDFAWSVPLGMEAKVYMISLTAITLDSEAETTYLDELAHGLRLPRDVRNHLHQRLGLPELTR